MTLMLTACGGAMDKFVRDAGPTPDNTPLAEPRGALKRSNGSVRSSGANFSLRATISNDRKPLAGADMHANVGISKTPVQ